MGRLTKRQQKRIKYFIREKEERKHKQKLLQQENLPRFLDKHLPYVRRLARNLDQLLIVSSFVSPPLKTGLIDRFLVITELEDIDTADLTQWKYKAPEQFLTKAESLLTCFLEKSSHPLYESAAAREATAVRETAAK